jgi:RNA polymerase sigma-70 factor (ECF subfamily)
LLFPLFMRPDQRLQGAVKDAFSSGKFRWPAIVCSLRQFHQWVVRNGIDADRLETHGLDIYLACSCALGDPAAAAIFDRIYLTLVRPLNGAVPPTEDDLTELRQQLRIKLLVGASAKIGQYRGQGTLLAWVQACATRTALNLRRGHFYRARSEATPLESLASQEPDPELVIASRQSRNALSAALHRCLSALSAKEKTLLQMFFVEAISMEQIGIIFGVHRATIARWIAVTRSRILDGVCQSVSEQLQASRSEVLGLMGLARSEIDLSVGSILVSGGGASVGSRSVCAQAA